MGSASSKAVRASPPRKYPSHRVPPITKPTSNPTTPRQPGPTVHPSEPSASTSRNETINLDASDPDFAASLRSLGAVQPNPTQSTSSRFEDMLKNRSSASSSSAAPGVGRAGASGMASDEAYRASAARQAPGGPPVGPDVRVNPALEILKSRRKWADLAAEELGTSGSKRSLVDAGTIRQILTLRDGRNLADGKIEEMLDLKAGTVRTLGMKGIVGLSQMGVD